MLSPAAYSKGGDSPSGDGFASQRQEPQKERSRLLMWYNPSGNVKWSEMWAAVDEDKITALSIAVRPQQTAPISAEFLQ